MNKQRKTSHILNVFQYDHATGIIGLNGAPVSGYGLYLTTNINDGSVGIDSSASINALYLLKNTTKQFEISYDTSGATKIFRLLPYQSASFFQIGNPSNAANSNSDYVFISESVYGNVLIGPGIGNAVSNLTGATASIHKVQFNGAVFANNSIQATSFKITGGASTGFLKADGTVDTVTYLSGNQSITVSGDATGSGTTSIALTLANTAVTPGVYGSTTLVPVVTVDSKGRITSVTTAAISGSLTFTGDVTGSGTTGTSTAMTLAASGVTAGTYTKVTVDSKGRVTVGASATTSDISEGTNLYYTDARVLSYLSANTYATQSYVNTQVSNLVAAAPATLDTLNELAAALGNDPSFATTISTALGNRLRVDINNQGLSATLQGYGRTNLGLGTAATSNTGDFVAYRTFGTAANSAIGDFVAYRTFGTAANNNTGDFAAASHTHSIADVTGLQTALDGKQASGSYAASSHSHIISDVTGLQTALDGKQASLGFTPYNATNPSGYITSSGSISGSAGSVAWTNVTGRPTALSSFTNDLGNYGGWITSSGSITGDAGTVGGISASRIVYGDNSTATTYISNATLDGALKSGFYTVGSGGIPNATSVNFVLHTAYYGVGNLAGFDLACNDSTTSQFYLRPATGGGKGAWQTIVTNSGTWGINVSGTAGSISGFNNPTTSPTANTIMYRDGSGYVQAVYYYSSNAGRETTGINSLTGKTSAGAGYMYEFTAAAVQTFLGLGSLAYSSATIPTNNNQLTNGAGYITSYSETDTLASVTGRGNTTTSSMAIGSGSIPNGKLYVNSGSGSDVVALQNTLNTGAYLVFADTVTPTWANAPRLGAISNDMVFKTLDTERFRIASTGASTFSSTISASNFSGSSSGTNTGDQTNVTGYSNYVNRVANYAWNNSTLPTGYNSGIETSFVSAAEGWPNYGVVLSVMGRVAADPGGNFQLYMGHGANYGGLGLRVRSVNQSNNLWTSWKILLDETNYNSYAPTLTGGGASGTWGISISGNATTATNVAYSGLTGTVPTWNQNTTGYAKNLSGAPAATNGTDGWFRSSGAAGWYNADYSVGIYATEAGNVRTYNGANFIAAGTIAASNFSGSHSGSSSGTNTGDQTNISGNAATATYATNSSKLYSTDAAYSYTSAAPYYGYLTYDGTYWLYQVSPATPSAVRVARADVAGNATTAGGLAVHTDRNNEVNKIVRTDANGYIQAGWINTVSGDNGTSALTRIYASDDAYLRFYTPANFRQVLDVPTRTGGSASGSWSINAATATGQQSGAHFTLNTGGGGYGLVGVYNPDIHQGFYAMGSSYTLGAGGTLANFYGVSWSYDYSGRQLNTGYNLQHCMAVANAGVVATVIGLGIWTNGLIRANGAISTASTITANGAISTASTITASGGTMTGTLAMHQGAYYGTITFGSSDYWRGGISMRDAGNAEMRIWHKGGGAGSIYFATGFDGESGATTLPSDGMALKNNNLGLGNWGVSEFPSYKLHVKGTGYATSDFRAPIFYDSNDTGYYLDPNASGTALRIAGSIFSDGAFGTNGASSGGTTSRIFAPKGAAYSYTPGGVTGAIKIRLPIRANDTMWSMKVRIYDYNVNKTSEYLLGNYAYSAGAYNYSATYLGGSASIAHTVRFGNEGGYDCVWIGETSTGWSHPVISVMDFMGGYVNGSTGNWQSNWEVTIVSSFGTVGASVAPNINFNEVNSYSYRGNSNVAGTGSASYHPSGIYSTGTNWLYGTMYMNSNSINDVTNIYGGAYYASNWFRAQGDCGLYSQDYGGHFRRSTAASHGTWEIFGYNKGGYGGLNIIDAQGNWNNLMFESGSGGLYQQNGDGWLWYWSRGNGCLGIGSSSTTSGYKLKVNGATYSTGLIFSDSYIQAGGAMYASGDITAYYSDARLKENVKPIEGATEKLSKVGGYTYTANKLALDLGAAENQDQRLGVLAQEIKAVFPEVVAPAPFDRDPLTGKSISGENYMTVKYERLVPVLIQAINEQQLQIEELKNKLDNVLSSR